MDGHGRRIWLDDNSGGEVVIAEIDQVPLSWKLDFDWTPLYIASICRWPDMYTQFGLRLDLRSLRNSQGVCTKMPTCPRRRVQRKEIPSTVLNPLPFPLLLYISGLLQDETQRLGIRYRYDRTRTCGTTVELLNVTQGTFSFWMKKIQSGFFNS